MYRLLLGLLPLLVLLSPLWADDKPKEEKLTTAASDYRALMDEYRKALKESDLVLEKARTDEERRKIRSDFQKVRSKIIDRLLSFAETHPKDKDTLLALFFVLHLDTNAEGGALEKAAQLVLKDHVKSDRLTDPPILQLMADFPAAEKVLRGVLDKSPHHSIQALACLRLGQITKGKASAAAPEKAAKLTKEAEELFERVMDKYADVKEVAKQAKAELFEMRHLAVGKTLPDIRGTDSDDKEFKLSDYRGKVVVVSFWAEWCPPCMKMVPHERSLVKRLEGKPFALVGVNRNESRENLKKCEQKHEITWRSFFDGIEGPISTGHNIQRMPTIYVLDAKGVIRYMDVRGEALDKAVDHLLAELEKGSGK